MKRNFFVLMTLFLLINGCAGVTGQTIKVTDTIQKTNARDCIDADYKNNGGVFIKVLCPGRVIHVVARLRPGANYAVFIGDDPMMIIKASIDGILVFVNQYGRSVEIIPEMSDDELKKIKIKTGPPTADKPAYAPDASAGEGGE